MRVLSTRFKVKNCECCKRVITEKARHSKFCTECGEYVRSLRQIIINKTQDNERMAKSSYDKRWQIYHLKKEIKELKVMKK